MSAKKKYLLPRIGKLAYVFRQATFLRLLNLIFHNTELGKSQKRKIQEKQLAKEQQFYHNFLTWIINILKRCFPAMNRAFDKVQIPGLNWNFYLALS